MPKIPVLAIVGPTAAGKSALSLWLAQNLPLEVICMDSMQIYEGLTVGTAKPSAQEQQMVPHHLLDFVSPTQAFSVSAYTEKAEKAIESIYGRGRLPVLVGGTGLYLKALMYGLSLGWEGSNPSLRERLHSIANQEGGRWRLHEMLRQVDEKTADKLHQNDVVRVVRALEVYELTGLPISEQRKAPRADRPFEFCLLGVTMQREALYQRINLRVEEMMKNGLLQEVKTLLSRGVQPDSQAMQGIGYKELVAFLAGDTSLTKAVHAIQQASRRYAKRQWTWFRAEKNIVWLDILHDGSKEKALAVAQAFWKEHSNEE